MSLLARITITIEALRQSRSLRFALATWQNTDPTVRLVNVDADAIAVIVGRHLGAHRSYRLHRSGVALANELPFLTRPSFIDAVFSLPMNTGTETLYDVRDILDFVTS